MATYYVDPVNGSDTYDGTVPDYTSGTTGPWATIGKIFSTLDGTGGHTVWLAPGTYRQASAITDSTTYTSKLYIKGDPDCSQAWDATVEPGIVRITCTDANNQPQALDLFLLTSVNNLELWDCQLDGCSQASGYDLFNNSTYQSGTRLVRCVLIGGNIGAYRVDCDECAAFYQSAQCFLGATTGLCVITRCFGVGRSSASIFGDCYCDQCFGISTIGSSAFRTSIAAGSIPAGLFKNCFGLAYYGFYASNAQSSGGPGVVDCAGCGESFTRGFNVGCESQNGFLISWVRDIYAADASDLSNSRKLFIGTESAGTPATLGHLPTFPPALTILRSLARAFGFEKFDDEDMADHANVTSETYGLDGRIMAVRFRGESATKKYPFPWAQSDQELSYDATKKNIIELYRTSSAILRIPIKKATATTISIQCDWSIDSGSTYPQIELLRENDGASMTSLGTDTIVGGDSQGHTLSIALTTGSVTDKDIVATLVLKSRETTTNAYASFYGLTVT